MSAFIISLKRMLTWSSRVIIVTILVLIWGGGPAKCYARYTLFCVDRTNLTASPSNITLNIDDASELPAGTLIGVPYASNPSEVIFTFKGRTCSGTGTSTWAHSFGYPIGSYLAPEGNLSVYYLTSSGIGYAMVIADPNRPWQGLQLSPGAPLWSSDAMSAYGVLGVKYKIYFVTTAPLAPGNYIVPQDILANDCLASSETVDTSDLCVSINTAAFIISVKSGGCDINASTPTTVNLGRINANDLPRKGDVVGNVDYTISLKCNVATTVNMTLTDPNGGDAENGVLYNDTGAGQAENVGVQVLSARDGGTTPQTVHLNESFKIGNASEGQYNIPMSARYYKTTDSAIVGGKVSASVIYELSYQ